MYLALYAVGYLLLGAALVWRVVLSHNVHKYLSCVATNGTDWSHVDWYWKLGPGILYGIGCTMTNVLINPRRMREGYGTWFVIRCPSSCRDQRSLLRAGKVMT